MDPDDPPRLLVLSRAVISYWLFMRNHFHVAAGENSLPAFLRLHCRCSFMPALRHGKAENASAACLSTGD